MKKAKERKNINAFTKIRELSFIGLLTQGTHHKPHHLAMAKGDYQIQNH